MLAASVAGDILVHLDSAITGINDRNVGLLFATPPGKVNSLRPGRKTQSTVMACQSLCDDIHAYGDRFRWRRARVVLT